MADKDKNNQGAEDTGHEWDGIRELKNDPPRWWMILFKLTPVWIAGYFLLYPSIPFVGGSNSKGLLGWTSLGEYNKGRQEIDSIRAPFEKKIAAMTAKEILNDPEMANYAVASIKQTFGDICAKCHGSGGQGGHNFPILADDDWLYGGTIEKIQETVTEGRGGIMPSFKGRFTPEEQKDLMQFLDDAQHGKTFEPGRKVFMGETKAAAECPTCHGENAKGNYDVGSANLTDAICRFDCTREGLEHTLLHGVNDDGDPMTRKATMPAWRSKLTDVQIKKLAVRVFLFGGGQKG
ncbi:MAG: cytochrome-c oxidase, cbb3-type subunit III [Nitrospinae bacterium]|nr:cytochrome-c oxidase, cbb3-type subunit III [Nitrospinota bacterium]